ncbi:MAG: ABC transporter permease [Pseudomonadota bacterium]
MDSLPIRARRLPLRVRLALCVVVGALVACLFAPWLAPYPEREILPTTESWEVAFWSQQCDEAGRAERRCWDALNLDRSPKTWLGTDHLGRDLLSRLIFGARNTVTIALATASLALAVGVSLGLFAALLPPGIEQWLSRLMDVVQAVPSVVVALVVLALLGTSIISLTLVIGLLEASRVYRIARALARQVMQAPYVEAARLRGEGYRWVMWREVLPNVRGPLLVEFGSRFCGIMLFTCALSFLGFGIQPPAADWASMVRENAAGITFGSVIPLMPAAAIALVVVGVNVLVDWLADRQSGGDF